MKKEQVNQCAENQCVWWPAFDDKITYLTCRSARRAARFPCCTIKHFNQAVTSHSVTCMHGLLRKIRVLSRLLPKICCQSHMKSRILIPVTSLYKASGQLSRQAGIVRIQKLSTTGHSLRPQMSTLSVGIGVLFKFISGARPPYAFSPLEFSVLVLMEPTIRVLNICNLCRLHRRHKANTSLEAIIHGRWFVLSGLSISAGDLTGVSIHTEYKRRCHA